MSDEIDYNDESESDYYGYDSGPYCTHWADPWECNEVCKCGHLCKDHCNYECDVDGCNCEKFKTN